MKAIKYGWDDWRYHFIIVLTINLLGVTAITVLELLYVVGFLSGVAGAAIGGSISLLILVLCLLVSFKGIYQILKC